MISPCWGQGESYSSRERRPERFNGEGLRVAITFSCACGKSVQVGDEFAGRQGQCPSCGRNLYIPIINAQITAEEPKPRRSERGPWDDPPGAKMLPEPDDDVHRVMTHAGRLITANDDFFHDAPVEIGGI
jgi:hypothetical protein